MKNLKKHKLTEKLCANNLSYKNMTTLSNKHNFSNLKCNLNNLPDYLALYSKPNSYQKTPKTCVSFLNMTPLLMGLTVCGIQCFIRMINN